jgi:hypothetical protein
MANRLDELTVTGAIKCTEDAISPQLYSSILKQRPNVVFPILLTSLRIHDAYQTVLTQTGNTDDLALVGGTLGSASPMVQSGDVKASTTTRYARFQVIVPECYDAAETLSIVISAGMKTTVADTSCTVDVEAYRVDKISGVSADLCATAAQSINSLVFASKTFAITAATLSAGDVLDVRIALACVDAATGTAVIPSIAGLDLVCDIKG